MEAMMNKTTTGYSLRIVEKSNWTGQGLVFPR